MSTPTEKKSLKGKEIDSTGDRLQPSYIKYKPDFKELHRGSPVSPLGPLRAAGTLPGTSTSSSSSGSITGRNTATNPSPARSGSCGSRQSCEPSVSNPIAGAGSRPSHRHSPRQYVPGAGSGGSAAAKGIFPMGNICPSGKVVTSVSGSRSSPKSDVLGSGRNVNYGHGNIVRGVPVKAVEPPPPPPRTTAELAAEDMKNAGNERYKRGEFLEAIGLYEKAIGLWKENAVCRSNKAAALMGLKRLPEAVKECQEAVKVDPTYARAHQRLSYLLLRFGHVELSRKQMFMAGRQPGKAELRKIDMIENHVKKAASSRKVGNWENVLHETEAAIAAGVDSSPQLLACRGEAFLNIHQLKDAQSCLVTTFREYELRISTLSNIMFFGMICDAYPLFVRAQIQLALGRFGEGMESINEAWQIDARNVEVSIFHSRMKTISKSWANGDDLFKAEKFSIACSAYSKCLKLTPWNYHLLCKRASCWYNNKKWESAISDCNHALRVHPGCTKALFIRAESNAKLERWRSVVSDYEIIKNELPEDEDVEESLSKARHILNISEGKEVRSVSFRTVIEAVTDPNRFKTVTSSSGVVAVLFQMELEPLCKEMVQFLETLCTCHPAIVFIKVDVERGREIAQTEDIRDVPTFRIYEKGTQMEEIISPSKNMVELSVKKYSK